MNIKCARKSEKSYSTTYSSKACIGTFIFASKRLIIVSVGHKKYLVVSDHILFKYST